jgi:RHS repeat-associated protein
VVDTNGTTTIGYDALYQVTGVTYPNDDEQSFTYDPMGNRLSMAMTGESTVTYSYDATDQLTEAGGVSYGYDENGNQIERGSDTFAWDHENRLTDTDIDSVVGSYAYNGGALRVSRTVGANTVDYVWDVGSSIPVVLQDNEDNTYVYGLDLISRTDGGGDQEYYLTDGLGSTTGLTDDTGDLVDEYQYDVFGAVRDHSGTSPSEFTFTGEQNDPTGLEYLRARYYDPATGRFLGRDPVPYIQRYAYAGSNPVNLTDPTGLSPEGDVLTAAMEATAACLAFVAGKLLDINDGNPCAAELADLNSAVQAMLEATLRDLQDTWNALPSPVQQCLSWGAAGFLGGGGPQGAAAGCAAGALSEVWLEYVNDDPLSQCAIWAIGAAVGSRGSEAITRAGCLAGFIGQIAPHHPGVQCALWALIVGGGTMSNEGDSKRIRHGTEAGLASCGATLTRLLN